EAKELNAIQDEIRGLNSQIEYLEKQENEKQTEARSMENNKEVRKGMEQLLRKQEGEERAQYVNTTSDGKAIIPVNIANEIIEHAESLSNIFGQARKFNSVSGELRIPRNDSSDLAGFVGENEEIPSLRTKFDFVKLGQRRV